MGSIIGGIASGIGAFEGGQAATNYANQAAQRAMTGYNYLTQGPGGAAATSYINAGTGALGGQQNVQTQLAGLLGIGGNPAQAQQAFNNYKNSTGYQFQLNSGMKAINSNSAASGLLDSGANAKALEGYGQNLASTTFNNYLGQLGGLNSAYGGTAGMGQNMLGGIAQAGTAGGANSANALLQGGQAQANMWGGLAGGIGSALGGVASGGLNGLGNMFGAFNGPSVYGTGGLGSAPSGAAASMAGPSGAMTL